MKPFYSLWNKSAFRFSDYYILLRNSFVYSPAEEIIWFAMEFVRLGKVEGDYLEFGVAQGHSFVAAYHFAQHSSHHAMQFYAFDSFEGLPEITGVDKGDYQPFAKGEFAYDVPYFKNFISQRKVDLNKVHTVKGFYDNTLNETTKKSLKIKKASVVMVDSDLYESAVPVLNFVISYLQRGTIIIFDDWFCFRGDPNKGEERAFNEWLQRNPSIKVKEFRRYGPNGISFIVYDL